MNEKSRHCRSVGFCIRRSSIALIYVAQHPFRMTVYRLFNDTPSETIDIFSLSAIDPFERVHRYPLLRCTLFDCSLYFRYIRDCTNNVTPFKS